MATVCCQRSILPSHRGVAVFCRPLAPTHRSRRRVPVTTAKSAAVTDRTAAADRRHKLRGASNWAGLIPTPTDDGKGVGLLDPEVRKMVVMYGELAQVTYDSFLSSQWSNSFGENRFREAPGKLLEECLDKDSLARKAGYFMPKAPANDERKYFIYAYGGAYKLFKTSTGKIVESSSAKGAQDAADKPSWIGYISVSPPGQDGLRDICVAFRGTITKGEWQTNLFGDRLTGLEGSDLLEAARVHAGFYFTYQTPGKQDDFYDGLSPQQKVRKAVDALFKEYDGKIGSVTTTGHSLGGALAELSAYDLGVYLREEKGLKDVWVSAVTFGQPRVGNPQFNSKLGKLGVKVLRVANKADVVPKVPGLFALTTTELLYKTDIDEDVPAIKKALGGANWLLSYVPLLSFWNYEHAGQLLPVLTSELTDKGYPKPNNPPVMRPLTTGDVGPKHNLEVYLFMAATQHADPNKPRPLDRDPALLNKSNCVLNPEWMKEVRKTDVPACWYQPLASEFYEAREKEQGKKGGKS